MKYGIAKQNAQQFANERRQSVYIAKASKINDFMILFDKNEVTPNYRICETIEPKEVEKNLSLITIYEHLDNAATALRQALQAKNHNAMHEGRKSLLAIYRDNEDVLLKRPDVLAIYQVNDANHRDFAFESIDRLRKFGVIPDDINATVAITKDKYDLVYVTEKNERNLDEIYADFNQNHPKDYFGHSLSVSDVVITRDKENDKLTAHFVDSYGFEKLPNFFHEIDLEKEMKDLHSCLEYKMITEKCFNKLYNAELDTDVDSHDVKEEVMAHIQDAIKDAELENIIKVTDIAIHGSRSRGMEKRMNESDLDILIEYEGDYPEDGFFNVLHDFKPDYCLYGVEIDFNPINRAERTMGEYLREEEEYHKNIILSALESDKDIPVSGYYLDETGSTADLFPKEIADIVERQLEGYGYVSGKVVGELVKADIEYSNNNQIEIHKTSAEELLEDAIAYRTELLDEKYGKRENYDIKDESVQELFKMEKYQKSLDKGLSFRFGDIRNEAEAKKFKDKDVSDKLVQNQHHDNTIE